jgi:hypothetical protein
MKLKEGNRIKNIFTGKFYEVKRINKEWVLLHAEDGRSQVLTGKIGLKFIYVWEGIEEGSLSIIPSFPGLGHRAGEAASR